MTGHLHLARPEPFCPLSVASKDFNLNPGCWPRPPVNYCILIALALRSSHTGSLKVQQIYHFTRSGPPSTSCLSPNETQADAGVSFGRENFPFFQTAPEGWKNTIRHNLCFNSSFRKTCNQMCRDGKRKSCFWHLTPDGQRRLMDEIGTLPRETFRHLERSMSHPGDALLKASPRPCYSSFSICSQRAPLSVALQRHSPEVTNDYFPHFRCDTDSSLTMISEDLSRGFSCASC